MVKLRGKLTNVLIPGLANVDVAYSFQCRSHRKKKRVTVFKLPKKKKCLNRKRETFAIANIVIICKQNFFANQNA